MTDPQLAGHGQRYSLTLLVWSGVVFEQSSRHYAVRIGVLLRPSLYISTGGIMNWQFMALDNIPCDV